MQPATRPACTTCVAAPPASFHAYPDVHGGQVDMISTTCVFFWFCLTVTFEIHKCKCQNNLSIKLCTCSVELRLI